MLVECDEIAVPKALWDRVKSGEPKAKDELHCMLSGIILYVHALSVSPDDVIISTRDVCQAMNDRLTLTIGFE